MRRQKRTLVGRSFCADTTQGTNFWIIESPLIEAATPKVSIIVPNYNHAKFLPQRMDSVLGQTFQDFRLILLDNCSTDDSRSILDEYRGDPRIRVVFNERNSANTFKQWNKGIRLARGEYVWIATSDDCAEGRLLERLVEILENEPEYNEIPTSARNLSTAPMTQERKCGLN
jgi:glycosyltransferase involved in cell wall biosynthesis